MDENYVARLQQQVVDASRDGNSLDRNTITDLLDAVLDDQMPLADFEDWLAGSANRLPTAEEIIGVVDALKRRMMPLHASVSAPIVDTCGTGGDGSGTFNISTATAIVNMTAVTHRYGASPQAFIVVPLVCGFFVDLINALVISFFVGL